MTGIRHDAYANAHPAQVEVHKPAGERGRYLTPEVFGQPQSLSLADRQESELQAQPDKEGR